MRALGLIALCALLSGCNFATSTRALFQPEDLPVGAQFENGVWLIGDDPECDAELSKPTSKWPKCVDWAIIHEGKWASFKGNEASVLPIVFASGDPTIMQIEAENEGRKVFLLMAFDANLEAKTRVRAVQWWQVKCGTYPHGAAVDDADQEVIPFEGFTKDCKTESAAALRAAAAKSRPPLSERIFVQWLRTKP